MTNQPSQPSCVPYGTYSPSDPLDLHRDASPHTKTDSLMTITCTSLLGQRQTSQKKVRLHRGDEVGNAGKHDGAELRAVRLERQPTRHRLDLADFWHFATEVIGLLRTNGERCWFNCGETVLFYAEVFQLPSWSRAASMCWLCRPSGRTGPFIWNDSSDTAGCQTTRHSHDSYLADCATTACPFPHGHTPEAPDGRWHHHCGQRGWDGRRTKARWPSRRCKQRKLTVERPKLTAKGAATKRMAEYWLPQAMAHNDGLAHALERHAMVQLLSNLYEITIDENMFLSDEAKA